MKKSRDCEATVVCDYPNEHLLNVVFEVPTYEQKHLEIEED